MSKQFNIVICTLRYSDNLGDGVIGDCFEFLLKKHNIDLNIHHLDMAGRTKFLTSSSMKKNESMGFTKTYFYKLPFFFQINIFKKLLWPFIYKKKLDKAINNVLSLKPDLLIFAGGQVFNDILLNFPLKFNYVCKNFSDQGIKTLISGVGVSKNWSDEGKELFLRNLNSNDILKIYVRDNDSKSNFLEYGISKHINVTLDPAVWAKEAYNIKKNEKNKVNIGLGIANPYELGTQTSSSEFNSRKFDSFWLDIIDGIDVNKYQLNLFTNGSSEDQYYLQYFSNLLSIKRPLLNFNIIERPIVPADLVQLISEMDLVIAHRLHANIISYSFGIPSIALEWDKKVKSFMQTIKRDKWCFASLDQGKEIASLIDRAMEEGVDLEYQLALKNSCFRNIQDCIEVLKS